METSLAVAAFAALAQDTRLDIVRLLVRKGADGAAAGDIGEELGVNSATLTFHLKCLTDARLLTRQRSGRSIIYRADFARLHGLAAFLFENCCQNLPVASDTERARA